MLPIIADKAGGQLEASGARRSVLIIDDEPTLRTALRDALRSKGIDVLVAESLAASWNLFTSNEVEVVVLDEQLPDGKGHTLCPRLLEERPSTKVVFITGYPEIEHAIRAIRAGAFDYLVKPFELEALFVALNRCFRVLDLERIGRREQVRQEREFSQVQLVGESAAFLEMRAMVRHASSSNAPVLITGETGSGKSLVARALHMMGDRREFPFISLSCAALPDNLVEAELFGWERGSFTGAVATREGAFEMAHRGTLFLDEIGEMPLHLQPKLLAILEEHSLRRIGGRAVRQVDSRVVAATNVDLEQRVSEKGFRADLFYRLNVIHIQVPPLRQRREDIPQLALQILRTISGQRNMPSLAEVELRRLSEYDWPGNVRELRNVLDRSVLLHGQKLRPSEFLGRQSVTNPVLPVVTEAHPEHFPTLMEIERRHIAAAMASTEGNLTRAARILGISISTLKRRQKEP